MASTQTAVVMIYSCAIGESFPALAMVQRLLRGLNPAIQEAESSNHRTTGATRAISRQQAIMATRRPGRVRQRPHAARAPARRPQPVRVMAIRTVRGMVQVVTRPAGHAIS